MSNLLNALTQAVVLALAGAARRTSTLTGTAIDLQDYDGVGLVTLSSSAAAAGSSPTLDVKLQESADNSTFTDVTSGAFTQVTDAASLQYMTVNVSALKRYLRVIGTIGGTSTPTFDFSVTFAGVKKAS